MARSARFLKEGVCYYVQSVSFMDKEILVEHSDYQWFMRLIQRFKRKYEVHVYAYSLLGTGVYFVLHPGSPRYLPVFMKALKQAYAAYFNRKYGNMGRVWGQRYKSVMIHNDTELFDAIKLVEFIPVREKRALSPVEYFWSSCSVRILGAGSLVDTMPPGSLTLANKN